MSARKSRAPAERATREPAQVAGWIGLADATLLGPEPIELSAAGAAKLEKYGDRAEVGTADAAAILRSNAVSVWAYTRETEAIVLGHRYDLTGSILISGADLACFISQRLKPPVPTTGRVPTVDEKAAARRSADGRRRHNLPAA